MKLGKYLEAMSILVELIKVHPAYSPAYLGIATCLDKTGQQKEAQRYYRKFLQKRPLDINAEFAKARMEKLKSVKRRNNYLSLV